MCIRVDARQACMKTACGIQMEPAGKLLICDEAEARGGLGECKRGVQQLYMASEAKLLCRKCLVAEDGVNPWNDGQRILETSLDLEEEEVKKKKKNVKVGGEKPQVRPQAKPQVRFSFRIGALKIF
ncbi:hypothetical protein G7Z17_g6302 [Cylindrodendrum hubeiense]|uniref:Uncharacterized protein n=1 Tax=Cylindrodendrum hubeiense TaxID=595255 RepID=A0A9P5H508_9HYPO|nr:hypothetical protein G7Z17_g6302 [Cylindrodendrum hubeiense]